MTGNGDFRANPPLANSVLAVLLVAGVILLVPLVAMQFTKEVVWTLGDFVAAGMLLICTGLMVVLSARRLRRRRARCIVGVALALALILTWIELAVGIFGTPFAGS